MTATIVISLLAAALFAGIETAFVSSNKIRIEIESQGHTLTGRILGTFYRHPEQFIATLLIGNNIALVIFTIASTVLLTPILPLYTPNEVVAIIVHIAIVSAAILFTADFLPKTLFRIKPHAVLKFWAVPIYIIYLLLYPIARLSRSLSEAVLHLSGNIHPENNDKNSVSRTDLDLFIQQSIDDAEQGVEVEPEVKILQNALDFSHRTTRECMIPRTDIVATEIDETTEESLIHKFSETGYSKVLVYRRHIDHIVGYIHSSDLFKQSDSWKTHIRTITQVPESMPARKLMKMLMQQKKSIAVVVNEFGNTAGIVTLEDLVEEICGDIEDEHDTGKYQMERIDDHTFEFSGRAEIGSINERFHLDLLESEEYKTLAGYILYHNPTLLHRGDRVTIGRYTFEITKRTNHKIDLVRATLHDD